ncbi:MAG: hypothetical protein DRP12_00125 [Candidatus Aenigmatarchaeota archaeon]|nr:MAG: hypothetical protein DRP12_00125 [Candidatus Aenigmarchaeota archaeon]
MDEKNLLLGLGGALTTAAIDWAFEHIWQTTPEVHGQFPYIVVADPLPPVDDLITASVPAIIYAIGHVTDSEPMKSFGVGGAMYGLGMLLKAILLRNVTGLK